MKLHFRVIPPQGQGHAPGWRAENLIALQSVRGVVLSNCCHGVTSSSDSCWEGALSIYKFVCACKMIRHTWEKHPPRVGVGDLKLYKKHSYEFVTKSSSLQDSYGTKINIYICFNYFAKRMGFFSYFYMLPIDRLCVDAWHIADLKVWIDLFLFFTVLILIRNYVFWIYFYFKEHSKISTTAALLQSERNIITLVQNPLFSRVDLCVITYTKHLL